MPLDFDLFEHIRIKPDPEQTARRTLPACEWEGCDAAATHRAPKGRGREGQFHHFCLDHVRLYNKSYNYFSGMPEEAVTDFQKDATTGHRPTWGMGLNPDSQTGRARADDFAVPKNWTRRSGSPRLQFGRNRAQAARAEPVRRAKPLEKKALDTLGLPETATGEEIRARYKDLVKRHHPDANGGDRSQEARLQEIIQAHKLLRSAGLC